MNSGSWQPIKSLTGVAQRHHRQACNGQEFDIVFIIISFFIFFDLYLWTQISNVSDWLETFCIFLSRIS